MVSDFLFELGCEELPSAAVFELSNALVAKVSALLEAKGLTYDAIIPYATPRRLALFITKLIDCQPDQMISRKGPSFAAAYDASQNPTQALLGFAKSCGVDLSALTILKTDKGDWLYYEATTPGEKTIQLMPAIIQEALMSLPIAKPMRWGAGEASFVRPVHWSVMLYGEHLIETTILGVKTAKLSHGHRFHHPEPILIETPADYESVLSEAKVIADFSKRRQLILDQVHALAKQVGSHVHAVIPDDLLNEVTSIVEWPQALLAQFDPVFLSVPKEVLMASMQSHQKCFALVDVQAQILPYFITVSNIASQNPQQVIAGNEKVMRARLSDAAFFFEQDRKKPLSSYIDATAHVIFQVKLGSLQDKTQRLQRAIVGLMSPLALNSEDADRALALSKCDLMTGMVGEFPELQGLMGYYYAKNSGESDAVALALNEQYWPRFAGDILPSTNLGTALSLVDRLDTLVGTFLLGEKPSGVKDPFKLRRHALAVARILIANPAKLLLSELIAQASDAYEGRLDTKKSLLHELPAFILERLPAYYQTQGIAVDRVNAVMACQSDCLVDFDARLQALVSFVQTPESTILSAASKRVNNLLNSAVIDLSHRKPVNEHLFQDAAEIELFKLLASMEEKAASLCYQGDYAAVLNLVSGLKDAVDSFFERVMVLVEDESIQMNRLALLQRLQALFQSVADISLLSV